MAIRMMVSKEQYQANPDNIEVVTDYSGHSVDMIIHQRWDLADGIKKCPHADDNSYETSRTRYPDCSSACKNCDPLYMHTTYQGCVLSLSERNGYHDSDFYALVWDKSEGKPKSIEYASTRGWTYPNGAEIDATPEVIEAYNAYQKALHDAATKRDNEIEATLPKIGRQVKVVGGRKVAKGTVGEVVWFGEDSYNPINTRYSSGIGGLLTSNQRLDLYRDHYRVGIRLIDGTRVFVNAKHVQVIQK